MKIHTWLNSGLAARDNSGDTADYLLWFPAALDTLGTGPLTGTLHFTPKTSVLRDAPAGTVLLGIPVGDLQGIPPIDDTTTPIHLTNPLPLEQIQVVAGQNRPDTKRAIEILRDVPGERQFHTMPELFP
ncbi:hypothetical protein HMPREF2617_09865 [Corynebacterium sp. HMSC070H05]|uniref:hypothetical protein n=1 Tax=Corynebacterium sp. HMSC070H05 TaxID=1715096 RepID=UPI0008A9D532|nr:hypothetical protein [Corynebacterium sp. HMSC070H05]OHQ53051.1 hypothetical protein HMPREF2617_09865 [Corynebacterium sp. HMSC070H05]